VATLFVLLGFLFPNVTGNICFSLLTGPYATVNSPPVILQAGTAGSRIIYTNGTSAKVSTVAPAPTPIYYPNSYNILSGNWWGNNYAYRKRITINNNATSTLNAGYSVLLTFDTASLVSAGKMLENGNDLRIVWWNSTGESYVELDRVNETNFNSSSTKIWFKLQQSIAVSSSDNNYYLYYGYSGATSPPDDWAKVYKVGDDFNDGTITSGLNTTTNGVASITETGGECFMDLGTSADDAGMVVTNNPLPADKKFIIRYKVKLVSLGSSQELKTFSINQWNGRPTVNVNTAYNPTRRIHVLQYATYLYLVYEGTTGRRYWNGTSWTSSASPLSSSLDTYYIWEFISNGTGWYIKWRYSNETIIQQTSYVLWSAITDNGYNWWFLWSEPYTNYWWGDIKTDFISLRDYVEPEPSTVIGPEEPPFYVSGTVPTSIQTVDADYIIIKSAGSATSNSTFNPSGYTLLGSTSLVNGTVSDLTSDDGIYMWFRSYNISESEYITEVEFNGTSNTYTWTELEWKVDPAWTTDSVNVTIQLYDFNAGSYSTSGDGYLFYTSSATAGTDENKTQKITLNPGRFRDVSGNWRMKIKGVKNTTAQFDFKVDWIEFKPTYYTEYTVSTEFVFSNMTKNTPSQLNFTVVSEYDISSVNVKIQVWNYSSPAYVTSGEGYLTYTSSGSNETKTLSINTNPQIYTSSGNAKIKITGVKTTTTQYQQKINQVKLLYSYSSSPTYNYVLKVVNNVTDSWKIRLKAYSQSNIERLNNCTIYFRNASNGFSGQVYIMSGNYTQQTGPWYDLPASPAERYIAVTLQASNSEVSYVNVYLEILIPDKTTYARYILTFEFT